MPHSPAPIARSRCVARVAAFLLLAIAAREARAQQPTDSLPKPRAPVDSAHRAQSLTEVRVEAAPAPRASTPAERRLAMGGRLYTKADIEQVVARGWMDVARLSAGVTVVVASVVRGSTLQRRELSMHGNGGRCTPAVFVDGLRQVITEYDWDDALAVNRIESMEVYSSSTAPIEFRVASGSCGSVVIWTHKER